MAGCGWLALIARQLCTGVTPGIRPYARCHIRPLLAASSTTVHLVTPAAYQIRTAMLVLQLETANRRPGHSTRMPTLNYIVWHLYARALGPCMPSVTGGIRPYAPRHNKLWSLIVQYSGLTQYDIWFSSGVRLTRHAHAAGTRAVYARCISLPRLTTPRRSPDTSLAGETISGTS